MKAIIFGITGQDGFYLSELLKEKKITVIGVSRTGGDIPGNVADFTFVDHIIKTNREDLIFHLAANSTTSHTALFENHEAISTGSLNILEAVKKNCPECKVFLSGSGLQFLNTGTAINEKSPFNAADPYSVSRIQSVYAARYYRTLGIPVFVGYFFNHESPRRTERHVSKMIAEAVKRIAKGSDEIIEIGNLSTKKEWTFAGDVAKAVCTLVEQETIFEAVIGSGQAYSIQEWIETCFNLTKKDWSPYVRQKRNFQSEYEILVSDPQLIKSLGWQPEISLYKLAEMMLTDNLSYDKC